MKLKIITLILLIPLISSCTVAYFSVSDLSMINKQKAGGDKHISTFSIDIQLPQYLNSKKQRYETKYIMATDEVLKGYCNDIRWVDVHNTPDLKITVNYAGYTGTPPQEWLTGLSFGIIPSWSTESNAFTYLFECNSVNNAGAYNVDIKSYNHLALLPVSWVMFFTLDEIDEYQNALKDFMKKIY